MEILYMTFGGVQVGTLLMIVVGCWIVYRIKRSWGINSSIRYVSKRIAEIDRELESSPGNLDLYGDRAKYNKLLDGLYAQLNK
jgi:hypothetical protein